MGSNKKKVSLTPQHPGKVLAFMLIQILSRQINVSFDDAMDFISGKIPVTPELNTKLAKAFNTDDRYWIELQKLYDNYVGNEDDEETIIV